MSEHNGVMVALPLPPALAQALAVAGGESPDDLHVTLVYLGDEESLTLEQLSGIRSIVVDLAASHGPITGTVAGWGRFNATESSDGSDVVWAHVDCPAIPAFRQQLVQALEDAGIPVTQNHGFTPHVTLAYVPAGVPSPVSRVDTAPVVFETLVLAMGDSTQVVPLGGVRMLSERVWRGQSIEIPAVELAEGDGQPVVSTIQLARVGSWVHPKWGPFDFTEDRFARFIAGFNARVRGQDLLLDVEHEPEEGAAAWFVPGQMRMEPTPRGTGLFVDVKWTPRGLQLALNEEYKYVSLTFMPEWTDPETGLTHQDVVFGAALTTVPFVKGMAPVQDGLVMLSEFHELTEGGKQMAGTPAEEMRTDKTLPSTPPKKAKAPADGMETCSGCSGAGKLEDGTSCKSCGGKGEVPNVESLAEQFHGAAKSLCDKMRGQTGAPMVRQHLAATAKLMEPLMKKMRGGPQQMSDTDANGTAMEPTSIAVPAPNPEVMKLAERLKEVEEQRKRDAAELSQLREDKRRNAVVRLSEGWFPRKGEEGFRFKSGDRDKVTSFLMKLSSVDEQRNDQLIQLSENGAVDEGQKSRLLSEFQDLVNSIPEPRVLNLTSQALSEGDSEQPLDAREVLRREAMQLSEAEKIPVHTAMRRVNARRQ